MTLEPNKENRYFTGLPCINGHISERLISNRSCIECARIKKLKWAVNNSEILMERKRLDRIDNPEKYQMYDLARYQQDPRLKMLTAAKQRAKLKNLPFKLVLEDIIIPDTCPLLNIPLIIGSNVITDNSPSLDRIFNNYGYLKNNIIVISYAANRCKGNLNATMLLKLATNLKELEQKQMPEWLALEKGFI